MIIIYHSLTSIMKVENSKLYEKEKLGTKVPDSVVLIPTEMKTSDNFKLDDSCLFKLNPALIQVDLYEKITFILLRHLWSSKLKM